MQKITFCFLILCAIFSACTEKQLSDSEAQKIKDKQIIRAYIAEKNLIMDSTASGIYYKITEIGDGDKPENGKTVYIGYSASVLYGKVFKSTAFNQPISFELGAEGNRVPGEVIKAMQEIVPLMRDGERRTLLVPSHLAFGTKGSAPIIPPNAVLLYDIKLLGF